MITLDLYDLEEACDYLGIEQSKFHSKYYLFVDSIPYNMKRYYLKEDLDKGFAMERLFKLKDSEMPVLNKMDVENKIHFRKSYLNSEIFIAEFDNKSWMKNSEFLSQKVPSIYILILNEEIIYVGKSNNIFSRLKSHRYSNKEFDKIHVLFYDDFLNFEKSERSLIRKYSPKYNTHYIIKENQK